MTEMGQGVASYREVQRFRQVWLWAVVLSVAILSLYFLAEQVLSQPAPDTPFVVIAVIFGLGFPLLFYSLNLTVMVFPDGVHFRFFPLQWSYRRIPLDEVESCEARTYSPLKEYGGWGIRYGRKGKAYNVSGNRGVQLVLSSGERILLGSRTPEDLALAINSARKAGGKQ
ncbi:MAG: hypothetical protein IBX68_11860 [Dehalococcoidia bacterium]|nr:hypothetical protein [Dehalococcoidia bacterium]